MQGQLPEQIPFKNDKQIGAGGEWVVASRGRRQDVCGSWYLGDTMTLAERLYPEAEYQLNATRRVIANVPDGCNDFAAHSRSMPLTRLAGHTAELAGFVYFFLTRDEIDMGTPEDPRKILRMTTKDELLAEFDGLAARALETLKATTDAAFDETFTLKRQGNLIVARPRYEVYRSMFMDHMIHHRAQLGVYLRLLEQPVPATFGPSADEK